MTPSQRTYRLITIGVIAWLTLVILGGFLLRIPRINILEHTARNLYFHVPMWFTMLAASFVAFYHSWKTIGFMAEREVSYEESKPAISSEILRIWSRMWARKRTSGGRALSSVNAMLHDIRAREASRVAVLFGILGLVTGSVWSRYTWYVGEAIWWSFDPKQTLAAIGVLMYGAYFVLRSTIDEPTKKARIAAVYNLFASATLPFLLYVLPRQMDSLHPGAEGNPAFSEITHPIMRVVFYPAVIGFIGLFWVIYSQRVRLAIIERRLFSRWEFES